MKICVIYFSATGNTEKIANEIKIELVQLNNEVSGYNIANRNIRKEMNNFELYDAIIFGFPVYYLRAPRIVREWMLTRKGNGIKCSMFFTYGGVEVGISHSNMQNILTKQNFELVASAEFLTKHTYNLAGFKLMENHPNNIDFKIVREFAKISYHKFLKHDNQELLLESPNLSEEQVNKIEVTFRRAIPIPYIDPESCNECGICEKLCPTNAMEIKRRKPRRKDCIRCLRCLVSCPEKAIKIPDMTPQYQYLKKHMKIDEKALKKIRSKIFN